VVELFSYLPTPGITDEEVTVFLAAVDAAGVPERTNAGGEDIAILRVPIDAALAALRSGAIHNGLLIVALQWLALNRDRVGALLRADQPKS
jgi:ADP-ribose pyrophosphatase